MLLRALAAQERGSGRCARSTKSRLRRGVAGLEGVSWGDVADEAALAAGSSRSMSVRELPWPPISRSSWSALWIGVVVVAAGDFAMLLGLRCWAATRSVLSWCASVDGA